MTISAVINTYNEAEKLSGCLESIKDFADEIVIVDMGSSDATLDIAKEFGAKIYSHPHLDYVEPARNFGLEKAKGEWILVLDPDERIGTSLKNSLKEISQNPNIDAVNIARKNIIFGAWVKHSNWWPDKHVRFFKKGKVKWSETIHQYPKVLGSIEELSSEEELAIEHFNYDNVTQFLERQNRYSEISAENRFKKGERFSWVKFFWNPTRLFLQRYFRHLGFLDGFLGFTLAILVTYSQIGEEVKLWEKEKVK